MVKLSDFLRDLLTFQIQITNQAHKKQIYKCDHKSVASMTSKSSWRWEWQSMRLKHVERTLQSWRKITRKISGNWIMNDVGLCRQAACRAVTHTWIHSRHTYGAVYSAAHILLEYSICRKDKSRRGRLSFAQREGGTDRRRGVLPSFASAASLFYGPAEIYSPLLLFPPLLFFARNEWVYLHIHCGAMACKKTHNKLKTPNMKALWVVSAFLLRHLRLKRLPRASEGSKGLDKASFFFIYEFNLNLRLNIQNIIAFV